MHMDLQLAMLYNTVPGYPLLKGRMARRLNIRSIGPNTWLLDVRVKIKGGKERRRRETVFGTWLQAVERFIQHKFEMKEGKPLVLPRRLEVFSDCLKLYREKRPDIGIKQKNRYLQLLRDLGEAFIVQLPDKLEEYLKQHRTHPSLNRKRPWSDTTVNRMVSMVNAVLNLAVSMELLGKNPISKARFPKYKEIARDRVLTPAECGRLLDILNRDAPHLYPLVKYALQVPCRRSELLNMKRVDLDLPNQAIRVRNGTTKNDVGVWKPIPPDMLEYFGSLPESCPYLFYRKQKEEYRAIGEFKKSWQRCLGLAGIEDFRFHDTRHISATNLLDSGTPEHVVLQVAGWKTNMLKTYYHRDGKKALQMVRFL